MTSLGRKGFTIVELLIVIVVISILAAITIVAYNGISNHAKIASLQSTLSQASKKIEAYKVQNNDTYPSTLGLAGINDTSLTYINYLTNQFCIGKTEDSLSYYVSSLQKTPNVGACEGQSVSGSVCPSGFIPVPGDTRFGTNSFCIMKYEAKQSTATVPISQAAGVPWASITQADAISYSANVAGCTGCHILTEAEWMTVASNVLLVTQNWSGGGVGSGAIYNGHNDNSPSSALVADTTDGNMCYGTITAGASASCSNAGAQRRTLLLSNGATIWDFAGNVWEWTQATIAGNANVGVSGDSNCSTREWNFGSINWSIFPVLSRPTANISVDATWDSTQGIGRICTHYGATDARSFRRGGLWNSGATAGIFALNLSLDAITANISTGFRVGR